MIGVVDSMRTIGSWQRHEKISYSIVVRRNKCLMVERASESGMYPRESSFSLSERLERQMIV